MDILNHILSALTIRLDTLYPEIPIYVELVPNQLPDRWFILEFAGDPEIRKSTGERYEVSGKVDIAYGSEGMGETFKKECNQVFTNLSLNLGVISYEGLTIRPGGFSRKVVDGVLHTVCSFKTFLFRVDITPMIQTVASEFKKEGASFEGTTRN